jgi:NADH dehydrogenase FAD-containing subunit
MPEMVFVSHSLRLMVFVKKEVRIYLTNPFSCVLVHTVGAPLAHTSRDYIPKAWRKFEDFEELGRSNVDIVQGKVIKADPASMTVTYTTPNGFHGDNGAEVLHYDYLVVATGTRRPWPIVPIACTKSQYVQDAMKHIGSLERSERGIVVVGGGLFSFRAIFSRSF